MSFEKPGDKYLFVSGNDNGGTTVILKLLERCRHTIKLPSKEGESVLDDYASYAYPWVPIDQRGNGSIWFAFTEIEDFMSDPAHHDWSTIRKIWHTKGWQTDPKYFKVSPRVFVEKSLQNVIRAPMINDTFPHAHFIFVFRNPYASIEGMRRRYQIDLERGAKHWLRCTELQYEHLRTLPASIMIRYEDLTNCSKHIKQKIIDFIPELSDFSYEGVVKSRSILGEYIQQPIQNLNELQIENLSQDDIDRITTVLKSREDLIQWCGYELR